MSETDKKDQYKQLINSYFDNDPNYSKYSFKGMMSNTVSSIVEQFFHIVIYYFSKYSEQEFHKRMEGQYIIIDKKTGDKFLCDGFDFIGDWKKYHKTKFITSMTVMKANKHWFKFDENKMANIMIELLTTKGWSISTREEKSIRETIRRMHNIVYHSRDSLLDLG